MRSWCSMISMLAIAIVAGLVWVGTATAQTEFKITPTTADADLFGYSVSIDGDYAIVGANENDDAGTGSGSAYIFVRSGTNWTEQAKLTASDAAEGDHFGTSVSISGDYAIVGAHANDDGGSYSGSAYIFVRSGTNWTEQAKLTASDANGADEFGISVSIDGDYAIVGAYRDDDGGQNSAKKERTDPGPLTRRSHRRLSQPGRFLRHRSWA